jgi:hypothetical protein
MAPVGGDGLPWHQNYVPHIFCDKCHCILYVNRDSNRPRYEFPTNRETMVTLYKHYHQHYIKLIKFLNSIYQFDTCILHSLSPNILKEIIKYLPDDVAYCSPPIKSKNHHCIIL